MSKEKATRHLSVVGHTPDPTPPNAEAPPPELVVGKIISGTRYRTISKLGEGGMGVVYLAEHVDIERKLALKVLHADLVSNPLVLRQFRQEARAASRIGSPFICDVTDWGELDDGRVFFTMEYVRGGSLEALMKEEGPVSLARAIPILRMMAKALGAAHAEGIVHLDVKPDNVILVEKAEPRDAVKMLDFGVASWLGHGLPSTTVMGTPRYMAPERVRGLAYDHRADIYSLGVLAWHILAGQPPFEADDPVELMKLQVYAPPVPLNQRLTKLVPVEMESLVLRMMDKEPANRPRTMAEVETAILEAQVAAEIRTPWDATLMLPPMNDEQAARITRGFIAATAPERRRWLPLLGGGLALTLGVALAIFLIGREPQPPATPAAIPPMAARAPAAASPVIEPAPRAPTPPPAPAVAPPAPLAAAPITENERGSRGRGARSSRRSREVASVDGAVPVSPRNAAFAKAAAARGSGALAAGLYRNAYAEFVNALAHDPQNAEALAGRAAVDLHNGRLEEALGFARSAVRLAPRSTKHQLLLGDVFRKLGKLEEALNAYRRARTLSPRDVTVAKSIVTVKEQLGQSSEP